MSVKAKLIDLSNSGAQIQLKEDHPLPSIDSEIKLSIEWSTPASLWVRIEDLDGKVARTIEDENKIGIVFDQARPVSWDVDEAFEVNETDSL